MTSPIPQLSPAPCSPAELAITIKEEPRFSSPTPCESPTEKTPLCDHLLVSPSSGASFATATAPVGTIDKDEMLKEKDQRIEELIRLVKQQQRLVEALRTQLKQGKNKSKGPEPPVLGKVKPEPAASPPCGTVIVSVEQKEEVASTTTQRLHPCLSLPIKSEQNISHKNQQRVFLQKSNQQFVQQQAIQKLLQQQQQQQHRSGTGIRQTLESCQTKKRKCSEQKQQPAPLKKLTLPLQQQRSQRPHTLHGAAAPRVNKQGEPPLRAQQQVKRQAPRVSHACYEVISAGKAKKLACNKNDFYFLQTFCNLLYRCLRSSRFHLVS